MEKKSKIVRFSIPVVQELWVYPESEDDYIMCLGKKSKAVQEITEKFYQLTVQQRDAAWKEVEAKDKQIAELVEMLNVIWEDWSCDDCPEGEKMEELIHKYNKGRNVTKCK